MSYMDEREENIVEAAIRVFSRYGVKRTTMNDIAGEAGIVRQTLYNVYRNKDDVLRAVIQWHVEDSLTAIERESAGAAGLGDKLDILFEHMIIKPFEQLNASPHADDIISGINEAAREEIRGASESYRRAIEGFLAPFREQIVEAGMTPAQLADLIQTSAAAFKHEAGSRKRLLELLSSLKALVLSVTHGGVRRPEAFPADAEARTL